MNKLKVKIRSVQEQEGICHVLFEYFGDVVSSLIVNLDDKPKYNVGEIVQIVFKESELFLAKDLKGSVSVRNKFSSKVIGVSEGKIITKVFLGYKENILVSLISTVSASEMNLKAGDDILGMVKSTEVSIAKECSV